jgi:hypothetical protein
MHALGLESCRGGIPIFICMQVQIIFGDCTLLSTFPQVDLESVMVRNM